jgi:hypothetical protein
MDFLLGFFFWPVRAVFFIVVIILLAPFTSPAMLALTDVVAVVIAPRTVRLVIVFRFFPVGIPALVWYGSFSL